MNEHISIITQMITGSIQLTITLKYSSNTDLKEEIEDMVKDMKIERINQVKVYFKDKISALMKEMWL